MDAPLFSRSDETSKLYSYVNVQGADSIVVSIIGLFALLAKVSESSGTLLIKFSVI